MRFIVLLLYRCFRKICYLLQRSIIYCEMQNLGSYGKNVRIEYPAKLNNKIFIEDNVTILGHSKFIIGFGGKLIIKKNTVCSSALTVITGEHGYRLGRWRKNMIETRENDTESSVIISEDVLIGANVTLLPNVVIGRGAQVGACSVVTREIPPYAVAVGNPARVIRFLFGPEEIIDHEMMLYPENDRFKYEFLKSIQERYNR